MSGRANHVDQMAAMTSIVAVAPRATALRAHLRSIAESPAFKGSRRSQEFLQFVVERALDRQFDDLKERMLGVELFGRSPSYDTGDDAIVRVTACDVRKRLHQYYAEFGGHSDFHIDLQPGSYIPEIRSIEAPAGETVTPKNVTAALETVEMPLPDSVAAEPAVLIVEPPVPEAPTARPRRRYAWAAAALVAGLAVAASAFWIWKQRPVETDLRPVHTLPWSALIQTNRPIRFIFCDPEIVNIQRLLDYSVTLSDYANQQYWPTDMKPDLRRVLLSMPYRGASVAAVDTRIALRIDDLIHPATKRSMQMQTARSMRLGDFKTEDSFVLFGSPRSNPWVELFEDQLDFSFEFDNTRKAEFVRNRRPRNGEPTAYIPTAEGWGTGQAYAIVALIGNPEQNGNVLVLAGSNAEATEAAGKLVVNFDALSKILKGAGIDASGPVRRFEILLRVSTMAGSPNTFDVVACHALNGRG
jgi:hypothetical protein